MTDMNIGCGRVKSKFNPKRTIFLSCLPELLTNFRNGRVLNYSFKHDSNLIFNILFLNGQYAKIKFRITSVEHAIFHIGMKEFP